MAIVQVSSTFTRPSNTDAYADNDLVANSVTAGSVTPLKWHIGNNGGYLVHARLDKTDATDVANATFSLLLFGASPTVTNGDNGAIAYNISSFIDTLPFATMLAATDDAYAVLRVGDTDMLYPVPLPFTTVYGLLQAEAAYSPASAEVFTCYLTIEQSL